MRHRKRIEREAAAWVAERSGGDATPGAQQAFERWRSFSPHHARAYEEMAAVWRAADVLRACPPPDSPYWNRYKKRTRPLAIGAAVLALLGGGASVLRYELYTTSVQTQTLDYTTEIGARRVVSLSDGSMITLNTNSELRVHITQESRRIFLLRGEVLFNVAHERRPFEVTSANHTVRATGTEFAVRLHENGELAVLVVSGRVVLDPPSKVAATESADWTTLHGGDRIRLRGEALLERVSLDAAKVARDLAWTRGLIQFHGERLGDALAEINRYSRRQVHIDDPRILDMHIGGRYDLAHPDHFIRSISLMFGLKPDPSSTDPNEIHLIRAETR